MATVINGDTGIDKVADGASVTNPIITGGIYLGGTGSANHLDDYEEGTWTPVLADATSGGNTATGDFTGSYTKIGNQVTVYIRLVNIDKSGMTSGNELYLQGIPFSASFNDSGQYAVGSVMADRFTFNNYIICQIGHNNNYIRFRDIDSATNDGAVNVSDVVSTGSDLLASITYQTD